MDYSLQGRIKILIHGEVGKPPRRTAFLFNERNRTLDLCYRYVLHLVAQFLKTDSVKNRKKNNRRVSNEEDQIDDLRTFIAEPTNSLLCHAIYISITYYLESH